MANSKKQALKDKKAKARREKLRLAQAKKTELAKTEGKPEAKAGASFGRPGANAPKGMSGRPGGATSTPIHRTQGK